MLAGLAIGCATTPAPPVAVVGAPESLAGLAGHWSGDYWSAATGRRGTIRFTLEADTGAAWGDVWMFPAERPGVADETGRPRAHGAEPLQIRFVRVDPAGTLSGTIDPYRDPECECMLSTTFTGEIAGDRIAGTYTSRGGRAHPVTTGQWEVRRVEDPGPG
jgi:hypothetical protein